MRRTRIMMMAKRKRRAEDDAGIKGRAKSWVGSGTYDLTVDSTIGLGATRPDGHWTQWRARAKWQMPSGQNVRVRNRWGGARYDVDRDPGWWCWSRQTGRVRRMQFTTAVSPVVAHGGDHRSSIMRHASCLLVEGSMPLLSLGLGTGRNYGADGM